jgi:hypothetical protein
MKHRSAFSALVLALFFTLAQTVFAVDPCPNATPVPSPAPVTLPQSTLNGLASLRAAVSVYYGDTEGSYPSTLALLIPKYLSAIPSCITSRTGSTNAVQIYTTNVTTNGHLDPKKILGTGKWGYVYNPAVSDHGMVFVDYKAYDSVYSAPSKEKNLGNLGALRSAVSIYYGDTEGVFPARLSALVPRYLSRIPDVVTCQHGTQNSETYYSSRPTSAASVKETGMWGYVPRTGEVFISSREDNLYLK